MNKHKPVKGMLKLPQQYLRKVQATVDYRQPGDKAHRALSALPKGSRGSEDPGCLHPTSFYHQWHPAYRVAVLGVRMGSLGP